MKTLPPLVVALALVGGCAGDQRQSHTQLPAGTTVTVTTAAVRQVEVSEPTVGRLEAPAVPTVAAETAGQVLQVLKDAGEEVAANEVLAVLDDTLPVLAVEQSRANIARLEALLANQRLTVQRFEDLAQEQSVSQSLLDDAHAQLTVLEAQLREGRARLEDAEYNVTKTRIRSPAAATVQRRLVSVGDYVKVGDPMFELVSPRLLQAHLPFPEKLADELRPGLEVHLRLPSRPGQMVTGHLSEVRPMIGSANLAIEAIVNLENPGGWRAGGSVNASMVLETRDSVIVPAISVVRRPAGTVVYLVEGGRAVERAVEAGVRTDDGGIEIRSGLVGGETIVADGAGFLTDGAAVEVREG